MNANSISSNSSYDAIDAYVAEQMRRFNIPGASLAIVEGDQIVHVCGFGRARPDGETPTPQTPFFIGSLTKSFTALAVMQLVEAGKIELDAPVQRYLPWFRVADSQASAQTPALAPERSAGASVTVRHLLNQTSGLPMLPGMANLADVDNRPDAAEQQVRALSTLKITRTVGSKFEYSNLNYNVLGLIVEAASGESYEDYIQRYIFAPLEMKHSYTSKSAAEPNGLAMGHRFWFGVPIAARNLPVPRGSLASGQLIASAEDMGHYLIAQLNEGHYSGAQILSGAGITEMHHPAAEINEMGISLGAYGMGWISEGTGETRIVSHSGIVPDFGAFMALIPEQNKGMILLINANHAMMKMTYDEVGMGAAKRLAGRSPASTRFDVAPWVMRAMLLVPVLQIVSVVATLLMLRGWRHHPEQHPGHGRLWGLHILLPLIPNLSLAALPLLLRVKGLFGFTKFFMPDVAWIALTSGGFAGIWSILRTGLILRGFRKL